MDFKTQDSTPSLPVAGIEGIGATGDDVPTVSVRVAVGELEGDLRRERRGEGENEECYEQQAER